jgi:predicted DNA-binding transcriptional regulator AlpA
MIEMQNTLTPIQAAKYVGISEAVLRLWRSEGKGPRHFKAGEKLVRYRRANLDLWIEIRLSGGWRRSGHKIWVQISSLDLGDFSIHGGWEPRTSTSRLFLISDLY